MLRSMFTGISGLKNHQVKLDTVANNIANINTVGFKKGRVTFQDILSQTLSGASGDTGTGIGGINPKQVGLGMALGSIDNLFTQGNLQTTGVNTDMAIQGNGMFIMSDGQSTLYSRSGAFTLDESGNLVNSASGWKVQGWMGAGGVINTSGAVTNVQIPVGSTIAANETSTVDYGGNLDSATAVAGTYVTSFTAYDSLGATHTITVTFAKTALNTWTATASGAGVGGAASTLAFDPATGAWTAVGSTTNNITVTAPPAATAMTITPDFTSMTQYASDNTAIPESQNGYQSGSLLSYTVSNSGVIAGAYSNGIKQDLAQVALAHFANYGGLEKEGESMYSETGNSGIALVGTANSGGRGSLSAGTVEMSNVDLSEEFTEMITAQRGFQANSRSITTSDEVLQELLNLKR